MGCVYICGDGRPMDRAVAPKATVVEALNTGGAPITGRHRPDCNSDRAARRAMLATAARAFAHLRSGFQNWVAATVGPHL